MTGAEEKSQEADVVLSCAHYVQAAARLLPPDNSTRRRLELLAADLAKHGRKRLPIGHRPIRAFNEESEEED